MARMFHTAAAAMILAAAVSTAAFAADKVLKVGMGFIPESPNPYRGISLPPSFPHHAVYDTLTALDAKGAVVPSLAVEWKAEAPNIWIFKLRPGVSFSNGEPLTTETLLVSQQYMATSKGRSETIGSSMYMVDKVPAARFRVAPDRAEAVEDHQCGRTRQAAHGRRHRPVCDLELDTRQDPHEGQQGLMAGAEGRCAGDRRDPRRDRAHAGV